jgi:hypothetical protein
LTAGRPPPNTPPAWRTSPWLLTQAAPPSSPPPPANTPPTWRTPPESHGCLHALVGFLSSGSDAPRQLLALQCLVNLAGRPGRHTGAIAKAAGAYLVTLVSGTNQQLAQFAAHCLGNLGLADGAAAPVLLAQDAVPNLLNLCLAPGSTPAAQDAALAALYHLTSGQSLAYDTLRTLASGCLGLLSVRPPIHLLWLLYSLTASQPLHNHFASRIFLNQCLDIATYEIFQKCDSRPLVKLLTPVVRILGSLAAGPDSVTIRLYPPLCQTEYNSCTTMVEGSLTTPWLLPG